MSQAELAEAADISANEVSRIERGVREPRFGTIEDLARALQVTPTDLFAITPADPANPIDARADGLVAEVRRIDPVWADAIEAAVRVLLRAHRRAKPRGKRPR